MRSQCLWTRHFFVLSGELSSVRDLATVVFDLVHHGGFSYDAIMKMPVFERKFMHEKVCEAVQQSTEFQLALHDKKRGH